MTSSLAPQSVDPAGARRPDDQSQGQGSVPCLYGKATWRALGTYVQLVVHPAQALPEAVDRAVAVLEAIDAACNRLRADSDLSRVNRAAGSWVAVDPVLVRALHVALAAAQDSDGLVCPTLGAQLRTLGYDRDLSEVWARPQGGPSTDPAAIPVPVMPQAWRAVEIRERSAVRIPVGVELDLGATGKAHAADVIAQDLPSHLGVDVLVSLGGDVAVGGVGGAGIHPWQVEVSELPAGERLPEEDSGGQEPGKVPTTDVVRLISGGIATSTVLRRRWSHGGTTAHHLLDPRTGRPVRPTWRSASVRADSCATANAASTAAVVMGRQVLPWLVDRGLSARLVDVAGEVTYVGDWSTVPQTVSP